MAKKNPDQIFKSIALSLLVDHMKGIFPESSLAKIHAEYQITPQSVKEGLPTRWGYAYTVGDLREGKRRPMAYSNSRTALKAVSVCEFDIRAPIHGQLQAPPLVTFERGQDGEPDKWVKKRLIDLPEEERIARPYRPLPKDLREADSWILSKTLNKPIKNLFDVMEVYGSPTGFSGRDIIERFLNWRRELAKKYGNKLLVSQDFTLLHEAGIYVMGFSIPDISKSFVVIMHVVMEEKPEVWRLDNSKKTTTKGDQFKPTPGSAAEVRYGNSKAVMEVDMAEEAVKSNIEATRNPK